MVLTLLPLLGIRWLAHAVSRDLSRPMQPRYRTIILLLVESGALITLTKLTEFVLYKFDPFNNNEGFHALWIVVSILTQINVRSLHSPKFYPPLHEASR